VVEKTLHCCRLGGLLSTKSLNWTSVTYSVDHF
jgi:hypothetical protein